jgi:phage/plasmid-like protein (TIGR03299 family)
MSSGIIKGIDGIALGRNLPAWHKLGTVLAGLMSPLRAFVEAGLDYVVEEFPVRVGDHEFPSHKLFVGSRGEQSWPIGVVTAGTRATAPAEFFSMLEKLYKGAPVIDVAASLHAGAVYFALAKADAYKVSNGDEIHEFHLWSNSLDNSRPMACQATTVRVVCANTLAMADSSGKRLFSVRNTSGGLERFQSMAEARMEAEQAHAQGRAVLNRLAALEMSKAEFAAFSEVLMPSKVDSKRDKARTARETMQMLFVEGSGNRGQTRFDGLNAVTEFVDHYRSTRVEGGDNMSDEQRTRAEAETRFESVLFGSGDAMKARALELLLN